MPNILQEEFGNFLSDPLGFMESSIANYELPVDTDDISLTTNIDMQSQPLPSLPSISNVGTVPFTGVVQWNAIPGGFQPLPQVAGQKKKLYQLSQFHGGINQKSSPRDISDQECQEAVNVTFSQVGRIKLLGNCQLSDAIGADVVIDGTMDRNLPGYGLFQFTAPADHDGGVIGEHVFTCVANGSAVDVYNTPNTDGSQVNWITTVGATDNLAVAQIYYAGGNGLYVANSNLAHSGSNRCKIWVHRYDYNQTITTKGWSIATSTPLITSPTFIASSAGGIDGAANGKVTLEWDDIAEDSNVAFAPSGTDGAACVHIGSDEDNAGSWDGNYYFYISWLFDGGVETGLTSLIEEGATAPPFSEERLEFNFSIKNVDSTAVSSTNYMGGDIRIEGARIYFKESGTTERWLLAEVSLIDGVKGALDSTFTPWDHTDNVYDLASNVIFDAPPSVYSYASLNGYYANEVYDKSGDTITDNNAGPAPLSVRYKTAVVGQQGVVFIGNVEFDKKHMPDMMMFSMPNKPGLFPKFNFFDSPSSDGSPITALASFQDTILQFKENSMYVINVSNPPGYAEASFRDCGVFNPCQVFTTSFGVIFVNKFGCFIYDGQKVISLTSGKFDWLNQSDITEEIANVDTACLPCVGYDPRSQNIIVLKDIGDDAGTASQTEEGAWIYSMLTQSWTEGADMITNGDGLRHTNFIITSDGYLTHKRSNDGTLHNFGQGGTSPASQTITYWTKDLDFGLPSQTKKLFKVYITYKGDASNLTVKYGVDGETDTNDLYQFSSSDTPLLDKNSAADLESWHVAELTPTTASEGKGWKSISLYFNGSVDDTFEINDISILYRVRPIK